MDGLKSFALWSQSVSESEIRTLRTLRLCRSWVVGVDVVCIGWILDIVLFLTLVTTHLGRLE